jgi:TPR repeat protein
LSEKPAQIEPVKAHWVSSRDRAQMREMLLETARALVDCDGAAALTLSAVAAEAGISRATMYGYFSGKAELLQALMARNEGGGRSPEPEATVDEAPTLEPDAPAAAEPQSVSWLDDQPGAQDEPPPEDIPTGAPSAIEEPAPEPASIEAEALVEALADGETQTAESEAPAAIEEPALEAAVAAQAEDDEAPTPFEQQRRLQAAHLEEIAKRLILPESALKEGTDAVIARLETRIRVLERSIANLETGQSMIGIEAEKKLKPISDLVDHLRARADSTDARQLQSIAELRLSIHELTTRLAALDGAQPHGAVSGALSWPQAAAVPEVQPPAEPISAPDAAATETADGETDDGESKHAYLTAVRSLAKEGARQAQEREEQREAEERGRRRHLVTAAAIAAVCLGAVVLLFQFHPADHGVSAAHARLAPAVPLAARKKPSALSLATPLDRLALLANKGDAEAELIVGLKYLEGQGAPSDAKEAARWLSKAAAQGNPIAQNTLGSLYQNGRGEPADLGLAMHWYEAAAIQGNRHAMSNLAVIYAGGGGGPKNFAEAARWFQRSAGLGFVDAQFDLAVLFERGDGVPQSLLDAYKWYAIAARSGDAVAKARADAIATQVSGEELQAAQKAAGEFRPLPMNGAANDVPSMSDVVAAK